MAIDFSHFKQSAEGIVDWLKREYTGIRTGQASPSILDSVSVDAYGGRMPINQLATVAIESPKSLRITPWDKTVAKSIDEAIRLANLGVSVAVDSEGLRVSFPELTSERRTLLKKSAKEKLEEARIRVRTEREKSLGEIDRQNKDGEINDDEKFRLRAELQKMVDEVNRKLEEAAAKKDKEISE